MNIPVKALSQHPTIQFAAQELVRYRHLMDDEIENSSPDSSAGQTIRIGLMADLLPGRTVSGNPFDDEIVLQIERGGGILAGANPRSCLLAVYRLLREAGCRFLRPGPAGELIPKINWSGLTVHIDEKPSYRHRGLCIEGAVSKEIFLGILDWLPKNGMNAYFIQFREAFTFFDRWYDHKHNPFVPSEAKSLEEVRAIIAEGTAAISLRSLIYHAVGHGWTCEPFGIPGLSWESVPEIPAGAARYFAELNGKRELFGGVPLNTNLCYGNPQVSDIIVNSIVDYAAEHPEVDLIHFWLADGVNNHCECPLCRDTRPADFYVAMLNELDEHLTAHHLPHRIVFLIYVDLLWAPEHERLNNPNRFVLMFAPITRTYSQPFTPGSRLPALPPYKRNHLTFPKSAGENLAFLKPWQSLMTEGQKNGDSFDFDYHLMWDHYKDPGYEALAAVLHADLANLAGMGLNGLISCQVQRTFFPSPLLMAVMAQTLWNRQISLDAIIRDVYDSAFGSDGGKVHAFLSQISTLFHSAWLRLEEPLLNPEQAERLTRIAPLATSFAPIIQTHLADPDPCRRQSWYLLSLYTDYMLLLADFCHAVASDQVEIAGKRLSALKNWVFAHEPQLVYVFDSEIMVSVFDGLYQTMTNNRRS
ncbi:MAG: DUF4838 domain-containing protein [Clostridiaceae bacterium]|nr:DUF4838 domain-containing protein [Clostridiaceae bacterium]